MVDENTGMDTETQHWQHLVQSIRQSNLSLYPCIHYAVDDLAKNKAKIIPKEEKDKEEDRRDVMTDREYVSTCGSKCPYCGSEQLNPESTLKADPFRDGVFTQETRCEWCQELWDDVYALQGWEEQ